MSIDFGSTKYRQDRGFGFASRTFSSGKPVFFHIKAVRQTHPALADLLDNDAFKGPLHFWFRYELGPRGPQVAVVLDPEQLRSEYSEQIPPLVAAIRLSWRNVRSPLSEALKRAASDLLSADELSELDRERQSLETQGVRPQIETMVPEGVERESSVEDWLATEVLKQREFCALVDEVRAHGFTHSHEVSAYIVANKLGFKYPNVSGVLEMQQAGRRWDFNGGIEPSVYARLCSALGLTNKGSAAVPVRFTPYSNVFGSKR
jgi:cold shock CspA family protein